MIITPSWSTPAAFANGYQSTLSLAIDLGGRFDGQYTNGSISLQVQVSSSSNTAVLFSELVGNTGFQVTSSNANVQTLTYDYLVYESVKATGGIATFFASSRAEMETLTFAVTQSIQAVYDLDGNFGFCVIGDHNYNTSSTISAALPDGAFSNATAQKYGLSCNGSVNSGMPGVSFEYSDLNFTPDVPLSRRTLLTSNDGSTGDDPSQVLLANGDFLITPTKEVGGGCGICPNDIVRTGEHILGTTPITDIRELVAADANANSYVSAFDITLMRREILGLSNGNRFNYDVRFIHQSYSTTVNTSSLTGPLADLYSSGFYGSVTANAPIFPSGSVVTPAPAFFAVVPGDLDGSCTDCSAFATNPCQQFFDMPTSNQDYYAMTVVGNGNTTIKTNSSQQVHSVYAYWPTTRNPDDFEVLAGEDFEIDLEDDEHGELSATFWANPTAGTMQAFAGAFHAGAIQVPTGTELVTIKGLTSTERAGLRLIVQKPGEKSSIYTLGIPQFENDGESLVVNVTTNSDLFEVLSQDGQLLTEATSSGVQVNVIDALGMQVNSLKYFGNSQLVSDLMQKSSAPAGMYFIQVVGTRNQLTLKVVNP